MTKAMAARKSEAYKRGEATRQALSRAAKRVGGAVRAATGVALGGVAAARDFARGVAGR